MPRGLWRDGHWVHVCYESRDSVPISRALYEQRGYRPVFDELPTRTDYEASLSRLQDAAED